MKPAMADTVAAQQQISHTGHLLTKGGGEEVLDMDQGWTAESEAGLEPVPAGAGAPA